MQSREVKLLGSLLITGVLVTMACPFIFKNKRRDKPTIEAVAMMELIRQAMREYQIKAKEWVEVKNGDLRMASDNPTNPGLDINVGTAQYFSNKSFSVTKQGLSSFENFENPRAQAYIIQVDGSKMNNPPCKDKMPGHETDCALKQDEVNGYRLEMDSSGRTYISYDSGASWEAY